MPVEQQADRKFVQLKPGSSLSQKWHGLRLILAALVAAEGILALSSWQNNQSTDRSSSTASAVSLNLPPRSTPLLNGTSDAGALELCQKLGFENFARTSPSSFICQDNQAPIAASAIPDRQLFIPRTTGAEALPQQPAETVIVKHSITHEAKEGETFSGIIARQFGDDEAFGEHFAKTVLANIDLLSQKGSPARKAIAEITDHPDWTPRTSSEAWSLFMQATANINPEDQIQLK